MTAIRVILPELCLFLTAVVTLIADIALRPEQQDARKRPSPALVTPVAVIGFLLALLAAFSTLEEGSVTEFSRSFSIDHVSQYLKILLIFLGMITVVMGWMSREIGSAEKGELHALLALGTLGMCITCSAVHFLILFLSFEMAGISCFILAAFKRRSPLSSEAGLKYFVHGALTSILFAFGIVLLYGISKSFNIADIRTQLASAPPESASYLWIAFGLIFSAIAARMAIFPFHFLAPDVLEGAPAPVSAFISVSSKIAGFAFLLRLCVHIFSAKGESSWIHLAGFEWPTLMIAVAAVTMTAGNLTALFQTNLKRLLAYSAIGQIGYILVGLAVSNQDGVSAVLFSLFSFGVMTLGAYLVIQMVTDHAGSENIQELRGLVWKNPTEGVVLCIFLLGLAGLPPLMGFVGRFYILGVAIRQKLYWLSVVGAVNWVVGLTYYLAMIKQIFAPKSGQEAREAMIVGPSAHFALTVLLVPTVVLGFYWDPLMNYLMQSLGGVVW